VSERRRFCSQVLVLGMSVAVPAAIRCLNKKRDKSKLSLWLILRCSKREIFERYTMNLPPCIIGAMTPPFCLLGLIAVNMLVACSHPSTVKPLAGYYAAIEDAAVVSANDIQPLTPLADKQVTLVEWTDQTHYQLGSQILSDDLWVTLVPEVHERCQYYDTTSSEALTLRLQQLLGLPPQPVTRSEFVVMQVALNDVFRPCPDPDTSKLNCELDFPADVSEKYSSWFARQLLTYYQIPDGYPFTRLGYTYDWNSQTPSYGVSEYVIRSGAEVDVIAITPAALYCHPDHKIASQS